MLKPLVRYTILIIIAAAAALYAAMSLFLPTPLPENGPATEFSGQRAYKHISEISREVHSAGAEATTPVVNYLVNTLKASGIDSQVQKSSGKWMEKEIPLQNVIARIPGKNSAQALLIVTHFDSTPFGPGAGDNASGTAALLETARALKSGPQMENDVILLFEDGEEFGYQGGFAFVREHPWINDVRLVIGLDTAAWGPVVLLQTSPQNGFLIDGYAQSVSKPSAYGFFADADWNIAHDDSEILPFVKKGIPGIELEDPTASFTKHSALDTVEKVDPASIQHMGDQLLSMTRQYANMNLAQTEQADESFFTLPGLGVVHYPAALNLFLAPGILIVLLGLIVFGLRQNKLNGKKLGLACVYVLGMLVFSVIAASLAMMLFTSLFPSPSKHGDYYLIPASLPYFITVLVMLVAIYAATRKRLTTRLGAENLATAGLVLWSVFSLVFAFILKVGSCVFIWPTLISLAAWSLYIFVRNPRFIVYRRILAACALALGIGLLSPDLCLAFIGTGTGNLPLVALITTLLTELFLTAGE